MKLTLRNGIIAKTLGEKGHIELLEVPDDVAGGYEPEMPIILFALDENPSTWLGFAHGDGFDVVAVEP